MNPYTPNTNRGRTKGRDDIHHRTADTSPSWRKATAKSMRKAARRESISSLDISDDPRRIADQKRLRAIEQQIEFLESVDMENAVYRTGVLAQEAAEIAARIYA